MMLLKYTFYTLTGPLPEMQNAGAIQTKLDVASKVRPGAGHKIQKFYPPGIVSGRQRSAEGILLPQAATAAPLA